MISTYAIGVAAKLEDDVTPALLRIIDGLTRANALMLDFSANVRKMASAGLNLSRSLDKAVTGATALGDASTGLTRASYVLDTMAASSADLARNMAAARAETRGMGGGSGGIAMRTAGNSHRGHGIAGRSAEGAGIATLGVIGYGVYENAKLDNILTRAVMTDGVAPAAQAAAVQAYRQRIMHDAPKWGYTAHGLADFAGAYLSGSRLLRGMPQTERMGILDKILPYAAQESFLKQISLTDSLSAFIGAAHMSGAYTPQAIEHILPALISTSMATNSSMQRIENAAGYAVPILRTGLQIDPAKVFTMLAIMQRAGIQNSKSGTWLADLFMNAVPGNFGAGLFKSTNQTRALTELGLLKGHKLTYLDAQGRLDPLKMLATLEGSMAHLSPTARAADLKRAFGSQGARAAALLSDPKVQAMVPMLVAAAAELESPGLANRQAKQGNAAAQARQIVTNAQLTITNATATFMGPVNAALAAAAPASASAASFAQSNPLTALGIGAAGTFGALLAGKSLWALSKLMIKDAGAVIDRLVIGAAERATGAEIGGAALTYLSAGSGVIAGLGVAVAGAAGYALGSALNWALDGAVKDITKGKESSLGGWVYDLTHPFHASHQTLAHHMASMLGHGSGKNVGSISPYAIGEAASWIAPHSTVLHLTNVTTIDGHEVARATTEHLLPHHAIGAQGVNPQKQPLSPGLNFAPGM